MKWARSTWLLVSSQSVVHGMMSYLCQNTETREMSNCWSCSKLGGIHGTIDGRHSTKIWNIFEIEFSEECVTWKQESPHVTCMISPTDVWYKRYNQIGKSCFHVSIKHANLFWAKNTYTAMASPDLCTYVIFWMILKCFLCLLHIKQLEHETGAWPEWSIPNWLRQCFKGNKGVFNGPTYCIF